MAFGDILAILFWPLVALFALLCWKLSSREKFQPEWSIAFIVLVAGPLLFTWSLLGFSSLIAVFNFYLGLVLVGLLSFCYIATSTRLKPGPAGNAARLLLALIGAAYLIWGGWSLIGDHLLPRATAEGRIQAFGTQLNGGFPADQTVTINDRKYKVTKSLLATLKVGDSVRIGAGQGSDYVYSLEHVSKR